MQWQIIPLYAYMFLAQSWVAGARAVAVRRGISDLKHPTWAQLRAFGRNDPNLHFLGYSLVQVLLLGVGVGSYLSHTTDDERGVLLMVYSGVDQTYACIAPCVVIFAFPRQPIRVQAIICFGWCAVTRAISICVYTVVADPYRALPTFGITLLEHTILAGLWSREPGVDHRFWIRLGRLHAIATSVVSLLVLLLTFVSSHLGLLIISAFTSLVVCVSQLPPWNARKMGDSRAPCPAMQCLSPPLQVEEGADQCRPTEESFDDRLLVEEVGRRSLKDLTYPIVKTPSNTPILTLVTPDWTTKDTST